MSLEAGIRALGQHPTSLRDLAKAGPQCAWFDMASHAWGPRYACFGPAEPSGYCEWHDPRLRAEEEA